MSTHSDLAEQRIDDLLGEMRAKAEAERDEILAAARVKVGEIEERCRQEWERIERDASAEIEAELARERDRLLGEVRSAARSQRLELKRASLREVFDQARREVERRIGGDGYRRALSALISEALGFTGAGAAIVVCDDDLELAREIASREKLDCRLSGGDARRGSLVATSSDGRRSVDNGLHTRAARVEATLSAEVARTLFGHR